MAEPAAAAEAAHPVAAENRRPGDDDWHLERPARAHEIEGYASAASVDGGQDIDLFVHTEAPHWTLDVFRIGWYGGLGARRVAGPLGLPGRRQPMPEADPATGLADCRWHVSHTLRTADRASGEPWTSGVYLARLSVDGGGAQSYVVFVVRDDRRAAPLLVQLGFTTYQAYNAWGGKSLYHWGSSEHQRAAKVSFNRPFAANAQNPAAAYGAGAGEFITNLQPHPDRYKISNAAWDINMLRWLEREGYDLSYSTSLDTHERPEALRRAKAWLSIGHDEYWTHEMRDAVEAARDAGVHLGFFSANSAYWQVRLEPSPAGGANRVMVCHKKARADPLAAGGERARLTDKWRLLGRPEQQLIGVMYAGDPVDADIVVRSAPHWVFAGTGLRQGDRLSGLLGYEVDCVHPGAGPAVRVLAESPWTALNDPAKQGLAHMSVYTAPSGAVVFATGSIQWAWGLDDFNVPELRLSRLSEAAQRITRNVLGRFLGSD